MIGLIRVRADRYWYGSVLVGSEQDKDRQEGSASV